MVYRHVNAYKNAEVSTASKLRLVIMMYDGLIGFLNECKVKIKKDDIAGRGLYISKAQRIVGELQESLNTQRGGEVAVNLEKLYDFIMASLTQANISGDINLIDQSIRILSNLRQAWSEVMMEAPKGRGENSGDDQRVTVQL